MRQARAGITGLSPTDKVAKALLVETKMTGNADFPTPVPTLAELKTGREDLETAITEAAGGDHAKVFARQKAEAALDDLLVRMAMYVSNTAAGDELKILSTGFELRKQPEPIGPLDAPTDLEARTGALPGAIGLRCKPVKGRTTTRSSSTLPIRMWRPIGRCSRSYREPASRPPIWIPASTTGSACARWVPQAPARSVIQPRASAHHCLNAVGANCRGTAPAEKLGRCCFENEDGRSSGLYILPAKCYQPTGSIAAFCP